MEGEEWEGPAKNGGRCQRSPSRARAAALDCCARRRRRRRRDRVRLGVVQRIRPEALRWRRLPASTEKRSCSRARRRAVVVCSAELLLLHAPRASAPSRSAGRARPGLVGDKSRHHAQRADSTSFSSSSTTTRPLHLAFAHGVRGTTRPCPCPRPEYA